MAVPEHPDVVRERKRHVRALVMSFPLIVLFFGVTMIFYAGYAEYQWRGLVMPDNVARAISSEYFFGYAAIGIGIVAFAAWYIWYSSAPKT